MAGNSGGPVLRRTGPLDQAIGVHCYGGALNSASVIGPNGNIFQRYIAALNAGGSAPIGDREIVMVAPGEDSKASVVATTAAPPVG